LPTSKLTNRVAVASVPRSSRYTIFDGGEGSVKGFGLRVFPSGKKSWIFEYRAGAGGRRSAKKRITIGSPADFTADQARRLADGFRSSSKTGRDPQQDKADNRTALTVGEIARLFLADHVQAKRKGRTYDHYRDILERLVTPAVGPTKAETLSRAEIARLHLSWKHTPFQANRMLAVLGSMYGFARRRGLVSEDCNPCRHIEKFNEHRRERFLTVEELERLGAAIREAATVGIPWQIDSSKKTKHLPKGEQRSVIGEHAAAALRLLLFTGGRLREILHLRWSEVDLQRGLLLLSDSKTGRKTIVLNAPAMEILSRLPRLGEFVIAGDSAGTVDERPRADLKRPWAVVSRRAGLTGVRLHDLRHTYASYGAAGGLGLPIIGKLLGHGEARTTHRYAHLDSDPLRKAANAIGLSLASALDQRASADIIPVGHLKVG